MYKETKTQTLKNERDDCLLIRLLNFVVRCMLPLRNHTFSASTHRDAFIYQCREGEIRWLPLCPLKLVESQWKVATRQKVRT